MFKEVFKKKKGGLPLGATPADLFFLVVFVIVLLVFFILFSIKGCSISNANAASAQAVGDYLDSNVILLNYLRTPVLVDGVNLTMADSANLIYNPLYKEIIDKESKILKEKKIGSFAWCRIKCIRYLGIPVASTYLPSINFSLVEVEMHKPW